MCLLSFTAAPTNPFVYKLRLLGFEQLFGDPGLTVLGTEQ